MSASLSELGFWHRETSVRKSLSEISKLSPSQWAKVERMASAGGRFEGRSSSLAQAKLRASVKPRARKLLAARIARNDPYDGPKNFFNPGALRSTQEYRRRAAAGLPATPPRKARRAYSSTVYQGRRSYDIIGDL